MRKTLLIVVAIALAPFCAFAVDGVTLINQSTVMAAGGFPYIISNPGSYKLSGNLVPNLNQMALRITAINVVVDLNVFNILCSTDGSLSAGFVCVGEGAVMHNIAIRNGGVTVSLTTNSAAGPMYGLAFNSDRLTVEDLRIEALGKTFSLGPNSIIRHNILSGSGSGTAVCPSLIEGNVNAGTQPGEHINNGCVLVNNVGLF